MSKYTEFKGVSPSRIAAEAGVSQETLYKWAKRVDKKNAYTNKKIETAISVLTSEEYKMGLEEEIEDRRKVPFSADKIAAKAGVCRATVFNWFNGGGRASTFKILSAIKILQNEENEQN